MKLSALELIVALCPPFEKMVGRLNMVPKGSSKPSAFKKCAKNLMFLLYNCIFFLNKSFIHSQRK